MSKILVLAEKPSVGKELARVLGSRHRKEGYIDGDRYIVTWALGHLVTLAAPEHYDKQYKNWRLDTLPMLPEKMSLEVIPETKKQYNVVRSLLKSEEVASLIIATDAGREGELVARWIMQKAGFKKPVQRLWISSQTDKAIREGFQNLKDGKEYENLYHSAQARAEADWLVGLNVTRALTCKYNARLSAGRVQTPTLAIIAEREKAIRQFSAKEYYNVKADLGSFTVTYRDQNGQTAIFDRTQAETIASAIRNKDFILTSLTKTNKKTPPPALYDLTELQRDANKQFGFSPKQTLSVMQSLYERHKALTYPRTDSRYLTEDIVPTLYDRVKAVAFGDFSKTTAAILKEKRNISKSCINNAKVTDHHAIIPTEQGVNYLDLSDDEKKIYRLVILRFLTCFFDAYEYCSIKATFSCGEYTFAAQGREVLEKGWKTVYNIEDEEEAEEQFLPSFSEGMQFNCQNVLIKNAKTTPPARYTEATLLSAMENPSAFIEDKKMREYIGGGLGTPATRADIIEKLFSSFYIEKSGKSIVPTSKGLQLIELVPADLKEPLLTAKWEQALDAISRGNANKKDFIYEIRDYAANLVKNVIAENKKYVHDNITKKPCPQCGKMLLEVNGKRGKMLVCQDRDCNFHQNISLKTGARCPNCHKPIELFGDGDENQRTYICPCGHREKLSSYQKRRQSEGAGVSKHFVQNYLRNQSKQEPKEEKTAMQLAFEKAMAEKKK